MVPEIRRSYKREGRRMSDLTFLGISGSLRARSYNTALLRAAVELAPPGARIQLFSLAEIPIYNEDVRERGFPPPVEALRDRIRAADALLIVTPEYNYSIPGVLKNAIDWASRPPAQPFDGKPIALMGASPSMLGSARAQYHLRQSFIYLNAHILSRPELMVASAPTRFDDQLRLTDEKTRETIINLLIGLRDWTLRLRA